MALIVEDGTGVVGAESYVTVADWKAWADARGHSYQGQSDAQIEQALRRATLAIEGKYRMRWRGRSATASQSLSWPRMWVYDRDGWLLPNNTIPGVLVYAMNEAAIRELNSPGALTPDLDRGGRILSERVVAGPVSSETTYAPGASPMTVYTAIDNLLSSLIVPGMVSRA